ncbi:MAG TPA: CcmD family protein [Dehalococcoidia bacterium]|nr:CcmD family protein [Dehalococcoidia bacterium]
MPPITALQIELPSTNLPWLFAAFAVSWAVFFIYAIYVTRRQQEMQSQIRQLRRTLDLQETKDPE